MYFKREGTEIKRSQESTRRESELKRERERERERERVGVGIT